MALNFLLFSTAQELKSITITGGVIKRDQITTAIKTILSGAELEATRGLSLGESLKSIAGVNSLQTGPSISKPVIHGVYSNRVLIMNNGVRQEGQNWGNDHAPEIDPFIATKVTVIKGAASIRYGSDAIGGAILLDPKDLPAQPGIGGGSEPGRDDQWPRGGRLGLPGRRDRREMGRAELEGAGNGKKSRQF